MRPESAALGFAEPSSKTTSTLGSRGTLPCAPLHRREGEAQKGQGRSVKSDRQTLDPGPSDWDLGRTIPRQWSLYLTWIPEMTARGGPGGLRTRVCSSFCTKLRYGWFIPLSTCGRRQDGRAGCGVGPEALSGAPPGPVRPEWLCRAGGRTKNASDWHVLHARPS